MNMIIAYTITALSVWETATIMMSVVETLYVVKTTAETSTLKLTPRQTVAQVTKF